MARSKECPKCSADVSESYQSEEPDVGIGAGWYCDNCDLGIADEDGPEPHDTDVPLFGVESPSELPPPISRKCACMAPLESGFGLAGGGGIGSYMYCPSCGAVSDKTSDRDVKQ